MRACVGRRTGAKVCEIGGQHHGFHARSLSHRLPRALRRRVLARGVYRAAAHDGRRGGSPARRRAGRPQRDAATNSPAYPWSTTRRNTAWAASRASRPSRRRAAASSSSGPTANAARFASSMAGLGMPAFPEELFLRACREVTARNAALGFKPSYKAEWEADGFVTRRGRLPQALLLLGGRHRRRHPREARRLHRRQPRRLLLQAADPPRPSPPNASGPRPTARAGSSATPTTSSRPSPRGRPRAAGYMEVLFLDARERRYVEEGSSCNAFFYLKSGELATPELGDTILPGITRKPASSSSRAPRASRSARRTIAIEEVSPTPRRSSSPGPRRGSPSSSPMTHLGRNGKFGTKAGELDRAPGPRAQGPAVRGRRRTRAAG